MAHKTDKYTYRYNPNTGDTVTIVTVDRETADTRFEEIAKGHGFDMKAEDHFVAKNLTIPLNKTAKEAILELGL